MNRREKKAAQIWQPGGRSHVSIALTNLARQRSQRGIYPPSKPRRRIITTTKEEGEGLIADLGKKEIRFDYITRKEIG